MKITVVGAAGGEVTGSCYYVQGGKARLLVDCGLFQGHREADARNRVPATSRTAKLDAVLLTHAHLDHTGRLPLLPAAGFRGKILATPATCELTALILRDAAKIQEQDAERRNRRRERAGEDPVPPLYTIDDAERVITMLTPVEYERPVTIADGVTAQFAEAGHMLGSASIKLTCHEGDGSRVRTVIFSGDLGPKGAPILKDYDPFDDGPCDLLFLESTYGDRDHRPFADTAREFLDILRQAVAARGKILVPTFAVGRAQTITLMLAYAFRKKLVEPFPVFLDSPMAIEAGEIMRRHPELFDEEMTAFVRAGKVEDDLALMSMTATADESRRINDAPGPCLVMAGAGMCNAGRILHHLKHNLWRPDTHVVIVGYQAKGTLGRKLVDGAEKVTIHGQYVAVRGKVHTLGGLSAHAGQKDLLAWYEAVSRGARIPVALTHGEEGPRRALARVLRDRFRAQAMLPGLGETIEV